MRSAVFFFVMMFLVGFAEGKSEKLQKKAPVPAPRYLHFVTLKQFARLPYHQQLRYIRSMRELLVLGEKSQEDFGLLVSDVRRQDPEMFARWLMGEEVYAGPRDFHYRGAYDNQNNKCIYAANMRSYNVQAGETGYPRPNKCQPPECKGKDPAKFVRCGFWGSGLSGQQACIEKYVIVGGEWQFNSTERCVQRADKMASELEGDPKLAELRADVKALGAEADEKKLDEFEKKWVDWMAKNAYHPEVMAHLASLAGTRMSLTPGRSAEGSVAALSELLAAGNFEQCERGQAVDQCWDKFQSYVNDHMFGLADYCQKELDPNVIENLLNKKESLAGNEKQRKKRVGLLQSISGWEKYDNPDCIFTKANTAEDRDAKGCPVITVGNVLQKDECDSLYGRMASIKDRFREVASSYPRKRKDDGGVPPAVTAKREPDTIQEPPPPPAPPERTDKAVGLGCKSYSDVEVEEGFHGLVDESMRCMSCLANHEYDLAHPTEGRDVSDRWLSLLQVMARACGYSRDRYDTLGVETSRKMLRAFGTCGEANYNWGSLSPEQKERAKELIAQWTNNQNWAAADKGPCDKTSFLKEIGKDCRSEFHQIFGMRLKYFKEAMCPEKLVKNNTEARQKFTSDDKNFFSALRAHINKHEPSRDWFKPKEKPEESLKSCMREAFAVAAGGGEKGGLCAKKADASGESLNKAVVALADRATLIPQPEVPAPMVVVTDDDAEGGRSSCRVSHQVVQEKNGDVTMTFKDPYGTLSSDRAGARMSYKTSASGTKSGQWTGSVGAQAVYFAEPGCGLSPATGDASKRGTSGGSKE